MSQSPHDPQKVISFLKQYRPLPPPGNPRLESRLIQQVSQESQDHSRKRTLWLWLIPGAVMASLAAIGGYERWSQPTYQIGDLDHETELETFMVENWQDTLYSTPSETTAQPVYSDWLLLGKPEQQYVVSSP